MFYYLSKIAWLLLQPLSLTAILIGIGLAALLLAWRRVATLAFLSGFFLLVLSAWTSLGALMLQPLENRFARPAGVPAEIAGIIMLGGQCGARRL